jgi:multiple sugar transport system ATP-binding protein
MAKVTLTDVTKRWGAFTGVSGISLDIADKEFVVLLGPSGCGKTTTMRMIAGLEDPTGGEIRIGERVVNDLEPKDRDIAMVFQNYGLYPNLTVYENIRFPLKVRKADPATHDERVRRAADMVELGDLLERRPRALSGGQRQRVALARAIVRQPAVFLMDEPLSNLDAKLRVSTRAQLKNLQSQLQVTTIYVTHDQIEAMTLADRVVVMNKGAIQQIGTPTDIYDFPATTFVAGFIGSPAMNLIDGEIADGTFRAENIQIPGFAPAQRGPVTLGFRAEDAAVVRDAAGEVRAPIYSVELLGDSTMVTVRSGAALVAAKTGKEFRARIGEPIAFHVTTQICHLFDRTTGLRTDERGASKTAGLPPPTVPAAGH